MNPLMWAMALLLAPGALDQVLSLFGKGSAGRAERSAKRQTDTNFLTNYLLVADEKEARSRGREDRQRSERLSMIDRAAAREAMSELVRLQSSLAGMGRDQQFGQGLNMAAMTQGLLGSGVPNMTQSPQETGDPLIDLGIL